MDERPRTRFEWPIYADATLAGLSVLIPVPFVDDAFETHFRRRMPERIARARGRELPADVEAELAQGGRGWLASCLMLPVTLTVGLLKRLSRKLLYFLTVKTATDRLSHYWYRAFLLDHMLAAGHLETPQSARTARRAMERVLAASTGPLRRLADGVVRRSRDVGEMLRRARQGEEDDALRRTRGEIEARWGDVAGHLDTVAAQYEEVYRELQREGTTPGRRPAGPG
jgi:hypothetical protein